MRRVVDQALRRNGATASRRGFAGRDREEIATVASRLTHIVGRPAGQSTGYDVGAQVSKIPKVIAAAELDGVSAMHPSGVLGNEVIFAGPEARTSVLGVKVDGVAPHFAAR